MGPRDTRELVSASIVQSYLQAFGSPHDFGQYTRLSLRNKSYTVEAATVLQSFLSVNVIHPLEELDLADIIAGRPEAEALDVLSAICAGLEAVHQRGMPFSDFVFRFFFQIFFHVCHVPNMTHNIGLTSPWS